MYHFAICDDECLTCNELEKILIDYFDKENEKIEIDVFFGGESFCRYLTTNKCYYDLIFLDIELGDIDGIEVGDYIRQKLYDERTLIVYISSREHYALRLFEIGTFEFLIKPIEDEKVIKVLKRAQKKLKSDSQFFEYSIGKNYYRVELGDILYFQSNLRKVKIVTNTDNMEFYGKLEEIQKKLEESMFFRIHNSLLINLNRVKEYSYECVKMSNDEILNISKPFRKIIREKILDNWRDDND